MAGSLQAMCRAGPGDNRTLAELTRMTRPNPVATDELRALILEDQPLDAELTLRALAEGGFRVVPTVAGGRGTFEAAFVPGRFDLVLADYSLPDYTGLEALSFVRKTDALVPFILVSGAPGGGRAE